ncbi:MAG: hypothetical protein Q9203_003026 [Teloschistes exilis]
MNLRGYYIGANLGNDSSSDAKDSVILAFIQVSAKIHELFMIASLGAVLVHTSLVSVLDEHGLPLGLATSGFSFSRISYYWSLAFCGGSLGLYRQRRLRGLLIWTIVLLSGILAAVVGPASAILMLPRINNWEQFSTHVWLNGTKDDFWPAHLTKSHLGPKKKCIAGRPGGLCISAGLPMLSTYYAYSKNERASFDISTPEQSFRRHIEGTPRTPNVTAEAWTFAPHAPASLVLTNMFADPQWPTARSNSTGTKSGEVEAEAAAVRTVCNPRVLKLSNKTNGFELPNLTEYDIWSPEDTRAENYAYILPHTTSYKQMGNKNLTTIFLSPDPKMTSVTTGVLILGPENVTGVRFAFACSVDARWNKAVHTIVENQPIIAKLRGRRDPSDLKNSTLPLPGNHWRRITADRDSLEGALGYPTLFSLGQQPYAIDTEARSYDTTALGSIVMARLKHLAEESTPIGYWSNNTDAVESVVSTVFADALSRIGIDRQQLDGSHTPSESVKSCQQISDRYTFCPPPSATELRNWTPLRFRAMTQGYAWQACRPTDDISIAVLAIYIAIVVIYIVVTIFGRQSFSSWASIEELLLLAKNSTSNSHGDRPDAEKGTISEESTASTGSHSSPGSPRSQVSERQDPIAIRQQHRPAYTSSGIQSLSTMSLSMKIRTDARPEQEELQLVFTDDEASKLGPVRPNQAYW